MAFAMGFDIALFIEFDIWPAIGFMPLLLMLPMLFMPIPIPMLPMPDIPPPPPGMSPGNFRFVPWYGEFMVAGGDVEGGGTLAFEDVLELRFVLALDDALPCEDGRRAWGPWEFVNMDCWLCCCCCWEGLKPFMLLSPRWPCIDRLATKLGEIRLMRTYDAALWPLRLYHVLHRTCWRPSLIS